MNKYIGNIDISIVDSMSLIDGNTKGILFIEDHDAKLVGCITDGDIRRWILKNGDIKSSVVEAMNTNPHFVTIDEKSKALEIMKTNGITALPVIDNCNRIQEIIFSNDNHEKEKIRTKDLLDTPVIVMAGGMGTRLYPYTKILPKPLVPIGDTPIVERIIDCFCEYGVDRFYMTVNYKKGMIKSYFTDLNPAYSIEYVEENKPLGTGGSIKLIDDNFTEPIFVTNCDTLILADYGDIYRFHKESNNVITMVSSLKNIVVPYGILHFGQNGELTSMEEKPKLSYFINTGMYVVNPEVIDLIPDNTMFHMTQLVEKVMELGGKVGTYPISEDSFLDMGELSEMKRMEEKLNIVSE